MWSRADILNLALLTQGWTKTCPFADLSVIGRIGTRLVLGPELVNGCRSLQQSCAGVAGFFNRSRENIVVIDPGKYFHYTPASAPPMSHVHAGC